MLKALRERHKSFWVKENLRSLGAGLVLLIIAAFAQGLSARYVVKIKGTAVQDLFLDHLPAWDIDGLIIAFSLLLTFFIIFLVLYKPKYINFAMKSLAVFIIVRAFLISLTHLGANVHQIEFDKNNIGFGLYNLFFNTYNDFFFSGHTGIPFLFALIFWQEKIWRNLLIVCSVIAGFFMLVAHIHYSIDVFAAPFMTYSIYSLCTYFFKHDYRILRGGN